MPKRAQSTMLTQKELDAIRPGDKQTDHADGLVRGLALRVSPGGTMTWVLVKRLPGAGVRRIRLGRYVKGADSSALPAGDPGSFPTGTRPLSLKQAREEATRVLALINSGQTPTEARAAANTRRDAERKHGSVRDLLRDYIEWRREGTDKRAPAGERQLREWGRMLDYLEREAPGFLAMKAHDAEPAHVVDVLRPIFHTGMGRPRKGRGSKGRIGKSGGQGSADKVQTFLRAAFGYGLSSEHSIARKVPRTYGLLHNPVAPIPRESKSEPVTRALSHAELRQFWQTIDKAPKVGPILADLLRFAIASGGQRTLQLSREPWSSYDLGARVVSLVDRKGRGGQPRVHLVPMTHRMTGILERVRMMNAHHTHPWSTRETGHVDIASPATAVRYWLQSEYAEIDGKRIPPFTPRDLRRTCTQIMQAEGIADELADRLQSHGVAGVTVTHYRNNPELYLPEKQRALDAFDRALSRILGQKVVAGVLR